jgi:hypothetical protein
MVVASQLGMDNNSSLPLQMWLPAPSNPGVLYLDTCWGEEWLRGSFKVALAKTRKFWFPGMKYRHLQKIQRCCRFPLFSNF